MKEQPLLFPILAEAEAHGEAMALAQQGDSQASY
jgi:hypothetical protein